MTGSIPAAKRNKIALPKLTFWGLSSVRNRILVSKIIFNVSQIEKEKKVIISFHFLQT